MFTFTTIPFHKLMRQAVKRLLDEYAVTAGLNLQVYPGRPRTIYPPTAFRNTQSEEQTPTGPKLRQRLIRSEWVVVWGLFDSLEAVQQRDDFVDGFTALVLDNAHEAVAQSEIHIGPIQDIPNFVPDWVPIEDQLSYYATSIIVEGFAEG